MRLQALGFRAVRFFLLSGLWILPVSEVRAEELPPIIVSADKREVLAEKTGASVTIINRSKIDSQSATSVPEVLRDVAGLNVVSSGTPGDDLNLRLRGSDLDEVIVLIDGVSINNVGEHRALSLNSISLDNVERIEIVRGSQSLMYGSDAVGGVINIITKKGKGPAQPSVRFEGGNLQTFRESVGLSGSGGNLQYSASVHRADQGGAFVRSRYGETGGSFNVHYRFLPDLEMDVGTHIVSTNQEVNSEFLLNLDLNTNTATILIDPDNDRSSKQTLAASHVRFRGKPLPRWTIEGMYSLFVDRQKLTNGDTGETAPSGFSPGVQDFTGTGDRHTVDLKNFVNLHDSEKFSLDMTAGFEFEVEAYRYVDALPPPPFTFPDDLGQKSNRQNYAPYLQQALSLLNEDLQISAGVRFDKNSTFGHALSPRASVLYKLRKTGTDFRLNYGHGFHAPTINDFASATFSKQFNVPFEPARLQAELSKSYEVGVTQKLPYRVSAYANFFYIDFNRLFDGLQFIRNAYSTGLEAGVSSAPLSWLDVGANYTFTRAMDQDRDVRLANRPNHMTNAFIAVQPLPESLGLLETRLDYYFVGTRKNPDMISAAQTNFNVVQIDQSGLTAGQNLPSYSKLSFNTSYAFPASILPKNWKVTSLKVFGRAENLLNRKYQEKFGFPLPGITVLGGAEAKF